MTALRKPTPKKPEQKPMPPDPVDHIAFKLGEISGQLRELIHTGNNTSAKIDAIGIRVAALEAEQNKRTGASGMVSMILKSPAIGWLVGAAVTAWAVLTGRMHL